MDDIFDITIIGGGPAGLYSAFYSGLRELRTKIIEFQPKLGGKVHLYPEKIIWDVGGLPPITGSKFVENLVEQGLTFNPEVHVNTKVTSISKTEEGLFQLDTEAGVVHFSKTVIIAVGGGIITPQKLDIEGAERFEVTNLHYTVQSLDRFRGKKVVISGGGNAAIDWANELEPVAEKVYLTYRKGALKGHESQVTRLLNSSVECYFHTSISSLLSVSKQDSIEVIELDHEDTGEKTILQVDEVVINHGYERDKALLDNNDLNLNLKDGYFISGLANSSSNVEGLYAAGDVLHHDGKLHLIAGAFQDAANAVNQAKMFIEPDANNFGMVSSHNEIFKEKNKKLKQESIT